MIDIIPALVTSLWSAVFDNGGFEPDESMHTAINIHIRLRRIFEWSELGGFLVPKHFEWFGDYSVNCKCIITVCDLVYLLSKVSKLANSSIIIFIEPVSGVSNKFWNWASGVISILVWYYMIFFNRGLSWHERFRDWKTHENCFAIKHSVTLLLLSMFLLRHIHDIWKIETARIYVSSFQAQKRNFSKNTLRSPCLLQVEITALWSCYIFISVLMSGVLQLKICQSEIESVSIGPVVTTYPVARQSANVLQLEIASGTICPESSQSLVSKGEYWILNSCRLSIIVLHVHNYRHLYNGINIAFLFISPADSTDSVDSALLSRTESRHLYNGINISPADSTDSVDSALPSRTESPLTSPVSPQPVVSKCE